jgi:hypothetical protein
MWVARLGVILSGLAKIDHRSLQTTMIYTHVLQAIRAVTCPLDTF